MASTKIEGELQIDHDRGVVYFHDRNGMCCLRISNLPHPIPGIYKEGDPVPERMLDISHLVGQDWDGSVNLRPGDPSTFRLDQTLAQPPRHGLADRCKTLDRSE